MPAEDYFFKPAQLYMELSIVIPAFDEENKICSDIQLVSEFFHDANIEGELIIIDDGSSDNTYKVASEFSGTAQLNCTILQNDSNEGKGSAVKKGILASIGRFVLYADAGRTVPFSDALKGMELIKSGSCQIAFGSRKLPESKITRQQDLDRKIISKFMSFTLRQIFDIPEDLKDTQCGFKLYDGETGREIFSKLTIPGFLFEIETIMLAKTKGVVIKEFPVEWRCDRDSRLSFTGSSIPIIRDILRLRKLYKQ